ncbi:hypothetical protein [Methylocystis sp.]|uniref:hypothetical protein n=1 Tax=Methylocystis sp. TaxID=1911079 RepID=UPI003D0F4D2F
MTAAPGPDWAERMLSALDSAGLCEADLAALLGETPETVAGWLEGEEEMSGVDLVNALAAARDATGVCPYWIVTGKKWAGGGDRRLH